MMTSMLREQFLTSFNKLASMTRFIAEINNVFCMFLTDFARSTNNTIKLQLKHSKTDQSFIAEESHTTLIDGNYQIIC